MNTASIAKALGGDEVGSCRIIAPGPGHSARDRSMSILLTPNAPDGFTVSSFAGDDWRACKDYVRDRLGLATSSCRSVSTAASSLASTVVREASRRSPDRKSELARKLWAEAVPIESTPAQYYLSGRGLKLSYEALDGRALRFHPACPFRLAPGTIVTLPAMVAAMVDIVTNEFTGLHRTALKPDGGGKAHFPDLGNPKKMLGRAAGACVKLSADEEVALGLHIAEGIETALACIGMGFRPMWAALSAGGIERFPILSGIEALTIFADRDQAGRRAARACSDRWVATGKEVTTVLPAREGSDFADRARP